MHVIILGLTQQESAAQVWFVLYFKNNYESVLESFSWVHRLQKTHFIVSIVSKQQMWEVIRHNWGTTEILFFFFVL